MSDLTSSNISDFASTAANAAKAGSTVYSAVAGAAGSVAGGVIQSNAANNAAQIATDSANRSAGIAQDRYNTTRSDLMPYQQTGQNALQYQNDRLGVFSNYGDQYVAQMQGENPNVTANNVALPATEFTSYVPNTVQNSQVPGGMSQAELEQTPGYQFTRDQGLQAVQNSAAARGLGVSGAALKGAATYATGLADQTYKDQFAIKQQQFTDTMNQDNQNFGQQNTRFAAQNTQDASLFGQRQTQYSDAFGQNQMAFNQQQQRFGNAQAIGTFDQAGRTNSANRLAAVASLGENAGAQTGNAGAQAATAAGNYLTSGASGAASGALASGNALSGAINGLSNAYSSYSAQQRLGNG